MNNELLILKARRKGFTKSHFKIVKNSIMEQYDFIIIELFPTPRIINHGDTGIAINFTTRQEAEEASKVWEQPLIIDIKKLQSEKEIDDMSADISW